VSARGNSTLQNWILYAHVIGISNLALLVANDGESKLAARDLINVLDPSSVRLDGVGRKANQLDTALGELWLELCESTKLGGADWSVIFRVGEEDNPVVANELMEVDGASGGLGLEVWGNGAEAETGSRKKNVSMQEGYLG
jgi:hypothetical protein